MRVESDFLWLKGAMNAFWTSSSLLTVLEEVEAPSVTRGSKAVLARFEALPLRSEAMMSRGNSVNQGQPDEQR